MFMNSGDPGQSLSSGKHLRQGLHNTSISINWPKYFIIVLSERPSKRTSHYPSIPVAHSIRQSLHPPTPRVGGEGGVRPLGWGGEDEIQSSWDHGDLLYTLDTLDAFSWAPYLEQENYNSYTLGYFSVLPYRMAFWPRLAFFRNDPHNCVNIRDLFTSRLAPSTGFRGSSCCDSQISWRRRIRKVLPGRTISHSKTPINLLAQFGSGGWGLIRIGTGD